LIFRDPKDCSPGVYQRSIDQVIRVFPLRVRQRTVFVMPLRAPHHRRISDGF
jgi:hypothetical protein